MKKVFLVVILLSLSACSTAREKAFHDGVDQLVNKSGMIVEYQKYVDADTRLQAESKKIRKETAERLKLLVEEERKALED